MPDGQDGPKSLEERRGEWVEGHVRSWIKDPDHLRAPSEYRDALEAMSFSALNYVESTQSEDLFTPLYNGGRFIDDLRYALNAERPDLHVYDLNALWHHRAQALYDLRKKQTPYMSRPDVESAVARYLDLPFRWQQMDRTLVDVLVALQLFAFGNEMLNAPSIPGLPSPSPVKRHPFLELIVSNAFTALFLAVIWLALRGFSAIHLFPADWVGGATAILGGLFALGLAYSILMLPVRWWWVFKQRGRIAKLLEAMANVYAELNSSGPISARHITQRAQSAADQGVVWPAPLFALLDDIGARGGRF
jgi:hypothetical protein